MEETTRKQIVLGILAHVDSGKTTLSEAMLYRAGAIRKLGRVDHKDAFLDTDALERARGITIFSKQALLPAGPHGHHPAGHPRPCGLLHRDRAHPAGAGLRGAGGQRHRRCAEPHRDALAAAAALPGAHVRVREQDRPARPAPGRTAGPAEPAAGGGLRGFRRGTARPGRGAGPVRRAAHGEAAGSRAADRCRHLCPAVARRHAVPVLVRRGAASGRRGRVSGRAGPLHPPGPRRWMPLVPGCSRSRGTSRARG